MLPMRIHLPPQPRQAEGIALQSACQHRDGDHQVHALAAISLEALCCRGSQCHHAEAVPQDRGIEGQMQGVA